MPPVSSNSARRRSASLQPKRFATPGNHQTGSIAALVTTAEPFSSSTRPSGSRRRKAIAVRISGMSMCALVTAIDGRMSQPVSSNPPNASATIAPQGSIDTIRWASVHCGYGPIGSVGEVFVRSARWRLRSAPAATASARYTP